MFASKNVYEAHVHSTDRDGEPSGSGVTDGWELPPLGAEN